MEQEITSYADSEPSKREMASRPKNYWKSSFSGMKFFIQSLNGEIDGNEMTMEKLSEILRLPKSNC